MMMIEAIEPPPAYGGISGLMTSFALMVFALVEIRNSARGRPHTDLVMGVAVVAAVATVIRIVQLIQVF